MILQPSTDGLVEYAESPIEYINAENDSTIHRPKMYSYFDKNEN
jgi:hypothetical protein